MSHWDVPQFVIAGVWLATSQVVACAVWEVFKWHFRPRSSSQERRLEKKRRLITKLQREISEGQ